MTARQYLSQIDDLTKEIKIRDIELEEIRTKAESCAAKQLTGMPGGTGSSDKIGDTVSKMVDFEIYTMKQRDKLEELRKQIAYDIDALPDSLHRDILHMKYILCLNWKTIAEKLEYSESSCFRIHGNALDSFRKIHGYTK